MRAAERRYRQVPVAAMGVAAGAVTAGPIIPGGYYRHAPVIAVVLIAVIAARLPEVIPFASVVRPALSAGLVGTFLILSQSRQEVLRLVFTQPLMRLLIALLAWAVMTAPFALWPTLALSSSIFVLLPILMMTFVILACEPNARNLRILKLGLMGGVAAHGVLLLMYRTAGSTARMGSYGSLDANDLAVLVVIAFPFAVAMALNSRGPRRWVAAFATIVLLIVVVLSGSRGGTLALLAAALVYIASAKGARRGLVLTVLVVAGILTWQLSPSWFRARMATVTSLEDDYNTYDYNGRKQIWARAREYIKQNPVAGVGMLNFSVAEGNRLTESGSRGKWSTAHNSYLQVTSELGFVGGAIFLSILGIAVARALALRRPQWGSPESQGGQPEFLAALAGVAAGGYFLSHAYFYAFYALVALTIFAHRVAAAPSAWPATAPVVPEVRSRGARGFRSLRTAPRYR